MKTAVRCSIVIERPPEDIAAVLLDADKAVLWTTDLEEFEVLSRPPEIVGSHARLHYKEGDRRYTMEDELLEYEPNRRFLSRVTGDAIEAEVETVLSPTTEGTQVDLRWSGTGKPILLRLMLPFMRKSIQKQALLDLEKLKRLVESG